MRSTIPAFLLFLLLNAGLCGVTRAEGSAEEAALSAENSDAVGLGHTIDVLAIKDMDIREAIELIARKSGLNIVTGQNVQGRVTIFLKEVDARDALRMVLEANGLAFADEGGIVLIMTAGEYQARYGHAFGQEKVTRMIRVHFASVADVVTLLNEIKSEQGKVIANAEGRNVVAVDTAQKVREMENLVRDVDVQTVTLSVPLQYAQAQDLVESLQGMLTRSIGIITCDPAANSLIVTDTPAKAGRIKQAIARLDARGRKISLEAQLVHVVLNREHLGGVDWSGILEDFRNIRLWGSYDFLDGEETDRVLGLGVIAEDDFSTLLDALDTVGVVKEYPSAEIVLTQSEAVRVVVRMDELGLDLNRVRAEEAVEGDSGVRPGSAAFEFYIKLDIDEDEKVNLGVIPREPRPARKLTKISAHKTTLLAGAGKSAVMGGLIATEKVATTRKIPLMGDLPLLGFAFRFHDSSVRREEFVIFLTPKIVNAATPGSDSEQEGLPAAGKAAASSGLTKGKQ